MNLKIKNKIVLGSSLALVLVIILSFFTYRSMETMVTTADWVDHTHLVLEHASDIEKLTIDMETGQRGFLITGKEEFLEPYYSGKKELLIQLEETKALVSDNPGQVEKLKEIEETIDFWQKKAAIPEIGKRREVMKYSKSISNFKMLQGRTVGKEIFDNIRYEFATIRSEFEAEKNSIGIITSIDALKSLIDMETGQRGFLLTGKEEFLDPFNNGQNLFEQHIKQIKSIVGKSRNKRILNRSIDHIIMLFGQWLDKAVNPEIQARRDLNKLPSSMKDVTFLIEEEMEKRIMDDIRKKLQAFKQEERKLMAVRKLESEHGVLGTQYVIFFGTLLVIFSSLIWSFWLAGNISRPIAILKRASDSIGEGVYPGKIDIDSKDEIADLGSTFEKMVDNIKSNEKTILLKIEEAESAKEEAESAKEEADNANEAKSIFLANMSHEIRTPLNAVLGYAQILQRDESLNEDQLDAVKTINKSGTHLLGLINDVLDISKIEAGKHELNLVDFDLGALTNELKSVFDAQCKEKQLVFEIDKYPENEILVHGDLGKLRQVLINLIGNAVKFTDFGSVGCRFSEQKSNNHFLFEVTDSGKGIPLDVQESIFEPFKQDQEGVSKGGTGLGLAICRKQVKQMGGELKIDSEPGNGARFFFSLPLEQKKSGAGSIKKKNIKYNNVIRIKDEYKVKALVVDDVKENRDVLSVFLQGIGVLATKAENGRVALEKVKEDEPHIVFMDIRMPVMNGVDTFHEIRKQFPEKDIKIICITASTLQHQQDKYLSMGFDAYVSKPFQHADILEVMETTLNIEYDYKEHSTGEKVQIISDDFDWSKVTIPQEIKAQISDSVELGSVTGMEKACAQLESLGNGGKDLAQTLKKLMKGYCFDEINRIISKIG